MDGNGYVIGVYATYLAVAIGLTAWLARTLSRNGVVFLRDVFRDRPDLAQAVNHLLVVGFYMLSLGYAFFVLRAGASLDAFEAIQYLVNRLAVLLISLGVLHVLNVFVFWRIRLQAEQRSLPPVPATDQA